MHRPTSAFFLILFTVFPLTPMLQGQSEQSLPDSAKPDLKPFVNPGIINVGIVQRGETLQIIDANGTVHANNKSVKDHIVQQRANLTQKTKVLRIQLKKQISDPIYNINTLWELANEANLDAVFLYFHHDYTKLDKLTTAPLTKQFPHLKTSSIPIASDILMRRKMARVIPDPAATDAIRKATEKKMATQKITLSLTSIQNKIHYFDHRNKAIENNDEALMNYIKSRKQTIQNNHPDEGLHLHLRCSRNVAWKDIQKVKQIANSLDVNHVTFAALPEPKAAAKKNQQP